MNRDHGGRCGARARQVILAVMVLAVAAVDGQGVDAEDTAAESDVAQPLPRSHIQPVGEIATAAHQTAPPADTATDSPFGMRVTRAPDLLREHLSLGHGVGLVVADVAAGSTAHDRGFLVNDVLVLIDGQSLIVPEQLAVLLEATGTAAPRSCTLIRQGTRMTIALDAAAERQPQAAPAVRETMVDEKAGAPATVKRPPLKPTASTLALLPDRKKARSLAIAAGVKPAAGVVRRKDETGILQEDFDYAIELNRRDETRLVVRDARGRQIFDDVIETPEQRSRIPLAIRDRVEQLERLLDRQLQAATRPQPVAEIGSLDITPIQVK